MSPGSRSGRPRASSRETIAEAATELFLERGYEATTVADITSRAGVSRSSFFNYFASKGDIVWGAFDERMDAAIGRLGGGAPVHTALAGIADGFAPDSLALAIANAGQMGLADQLRRERALRQAVLAQAVAQRLVGSGTAALTADVTGSALAGAVLAAVWRWALDGPGRSALAAVLDRALGLVSASGTAGSVRQLRVVVRADDFDAALAFYRDQLGLAEEASYQGEDDARVAILAAGSATLELSNAGQIELIDRVETDGGTSDPIRIAFEVDDTTAVAARLVAAGAELEASARVTPWRSRNARLRAPAGLQVTLFEQLGPEPILQRGDDPPLA